MKTRKQVFETNSSSMHSITIADSDGLITPRTQGGTYTLQCDMEFGWYENRYTDWETKAIYCAISSEDDDNKLDMLTEVLKTGLNVDDIHYDFDGGHIDHMSLDVIDDAFMSESELRNFIFNPLSELVTDNDNH